MKPMKKALSFLLALSLLLGMAPQLALTAEAVDDPSNYIITAPTLNTTSLYFNGQSQGISVTPGEAIEGFEIRYTQTNMVFPSANINALGLTYPGTITVSYVIFKEGAGLGDYINNGAVSELATLGSVTMHKAIPEYVTRPAANNAEKLPVWSFPLVTAGTTSLPEYFVVEYKDSTGKWSQNIPKTDVAGKFTVEYRLAAKASHFQEDQGTPKRADELLDLRTPPGKLCPGDH